MGFWNKLENSELILFLWGNFHQDKKIYIHSPATFMKKSKSNEGSWLRKMGYKLLCILKSHTKGNVNSNCSSSLTFSKEIFGGNSSSRGFGKSGNNVPVLELREYFRAENDPCTQRKKKAFRKLYRERLQMKKKRQATPKESNLQENEHFIKWFWFYRFALDERPLLWYEKWEGRDETVQIFFTHFWLLIKSFQVFWVIELRKGKVARPTEGNYRIFSSCGGFIARRLEIMMEFIAIEGKSKGTNRHRESLFFFSA